MDLHLHPRMKSGFRPGCKCKPRQKCHSSCIVFDTNFWIPYKMIGNFLKSRTSIGYFSNLSSSFVMVNFMKSQTSTACFSHSSRSFVSSNFPWVSNLNRLFLKLVWFNYKYLILEKSSRSKVFFFFFRLLYIYNPPCTSLTHAGSLRFLAYNLIRVWYLC